MADVNTDTRPDLMWFNAGSGEVSTWLLNGAGTVIGTQNLSWTCGGGCSSDWTPIGLADVNTFA